MAITSYLLIDQLNLKEQMMRYKLSIYGVVSILFFSLAHAQDWRESPLTSTTSDHWRSLPYTGTTSEQWRNSSLSSKYSESKLRWNKDKWQKSPSYWRNKPYVERPVSSDRWQNRWDKRKWRYSPLNWRHSGLRYKNTMEKYEGSSDYRQIKIWVPADTKEEKNLILDEKKEYVKPQIETINNETNKGSENASTNAGHTEDYFMLINSKGSFKSEKSVQVRFHVAPGGLMKIYSSESEVY
jgi:hypothetical protein